MKQVRISDDAHAKILDSFSKDLRTVAQVVDAFIYRGDGVTVNHVNTGDGVNVGDSECLNCEKLQDTIDNQKDTIEGLREIVAEYKK